MVEKKDLERIAYEMSVEGSLKFYERQVVQILKSKGLPTTFQELKRIRKRDQLTNDLMDVLSRADMAREHIAKKDIESAVLNGILFGEALLRVNRIPFFLGIKYRERQRQARSKRKKYGGLNPEKRSERNNKIRKRFKESRLTKSSFAEKYAEEYGLSKRQIQNILSRKDGN